MMFVVSTFEGLHLAGDSRTPHIQLPKRPFVSRRFIVDSNTVREVSERLDE